MDTKVGRKPIPVNKKATPVTIWLDPITRGEIDELATLWHITNSAVVRISVAAYYKAHKLERIRGR